RIACNNAFDPFHSLDTFRHVGSWIASRQPYDRLGCPQSSKLSRDPFAAADRAVSSGCVLASYRSPTASRTASPACQSVSPSVTSSASSRSPSWGTCHPQLTPPSAHRALAPPTYLPC